MRSTLNRSIFPYRHKLTRFRRQKTTATRCPGTFGVGVMGIRYGGMGLSMDRFSIHRKMSQNRSSSCPSNTSRTPTPPAPAAHPWDASGAEGRTVGDRGAGPRCLRHQHRGHVPGLPPPSSSRWVRPLAVRCGATTGSWPPCIACWPCGLPPGWITVARPTLSLIVFGWFWASWHPDMPLLSNDRQDAPVYRTAVFRYAPPSTAAAWARPTQPRSATLWRSSTTPTTVWT